MTRACLCNGLMANIGHAWLRAGKHVEPALVTAGDDLPSIAQFGLSYSAADAIRVLSEG
jgi:nitronate monooxygenase